MAGPFLFIFAKESYNNHTYRLLFGNKIIIFYLKYHIHGKTVDDIIMLSDVIKQYQKLSERRTTLKRLSPKEVAERLGVSVVTLRRWDKKGILKAHRTLTNRYYYTEEQIAQLDEDKNDHFQFFIQKKSNLAHLNGDGTITLDSDMCSGTYNLGTNYVFTDAITFHGQTKTTIKHVPAKLTIDEKLKEGQKNNGFVRFIKSSISNNSKS